MHQLALFFLINNRRNQIFVSYSCQNAQMQHVYGIKIFEFSNGHRAQFIHFDRFCFCLSELMAQFEIRADQISYPVYEIRP